MSKKNTPPINPNRMVSPEEQTFLSQNRLDQQSRQHAVATTDNLKTKKKFKAVSLTMPEDFHEEMKAFVNEFSEANSVSALVVKATSEYMKKRKLNEN